MDKPRRVLDLDAINDASTHAHAASTSEYVEPSLLVQALYKHWQVDEMRFIEMLAIHPNLGMQHDFSASEALALRNSILQTQLDLVAMRVLVKRHWQIL
jgi:hypothetical protein